MGREHKKINVSVGRRCQSVTVTHARKYAFIRVCHPHPMLRSRYLRRMWYSERKKEIFLPKKIHHITSHHLVHSPPSLPSIHLFYLPIYPHLHLPSGTPSLYHHEKIEFQIYTITRTSNKIFITTFTLLQSAAYSSALKIIKINYGHIGKLLPPPHSRSLHSIASHRNHTYFFLFFSSPYELPLMWLSFFI